MTKNKKILLGIFTGLPILLLIIYFISFFGFFLGIFTNPQDTNLSNQMFFIEGFITLFIIMFAASAISIVLLIYYLIHVNKNLKFDNNQKLIWTIIILLAGLIGFCIYWYMYIWKDELNQSSDSLLSNQ